jgi:PAS domain S-box-containing protein
MTTLSEANLSEAIVAGVGDAVIFADKDGLIRLWNGGAELMFGYTAKEALGKSLDLIIPEKLRQRHWDGYRGSMATGKTRYAHGELLAVPAVNKAGDRLSVEFSIAIVHEGDTVLGIGAIMRDVTVRWTQERDLRARLKQLEATVLPEHPQAE